MRSRPSYSCARVNVGLVIVSVMPSPAPKPWAKAVLPAPRSPASRTRSPGRARSPSASARARVSSTVRVWATSAAARAAVRAPPPLARSPCRTPARAYRAATPRPVWRRSAARWVRAGARVAASTPACARSGEGEDRGRHHVDGQGANRVDRGLHRRVGGDGGGHEGVTVRAGVRREDRAGEAVVSALGDSVAGGPFHAGGGGGGAPHRVSPPRPPRGRGGPPPRP